MNNWLQTSTDLLAPMLCCSTNLVEYSLLGLRMRMMPHATQAPCTLRRAAPVSGVTFVLRPCPAFRRLQYGTRLQNNGIVKSEPKYMLSTFELFLVPLSLSWLLWWADFFAFFFSESPVVIQHSFMHLALQIHTLQRASCAVLRRQETRPDVVV